MVGLEFELRTSDSRIQSCECSQSLLSHPLKIQLSSIMIMHIHHRHLPPLKNMIHLLHCDLSVPCTSLPTTPSLQLSKKLIQSKNSSLASEAGKDQLDQRESLQGFLHLGWQQKALSAFILKPLGQLV